MMYVTWYDKEMNQTYSEWMTGEGLFNLQIDEEVTIISIEEEDKQSSFFKPLHFNALKQ